MKRSPALTRTALVLAAVALAAGMVAAQTPPDKFLGHKVGEDRKLADYTQIKAYFEKLAQESNKIKLFTIGESILKKPMIMAAISTPENLAKLDRWKEITRKLRDPRATSVDEARKLAKEGKAIVLITCSLHATEIAASQMSMELAYDLVTGKTFFDAGKILNDVVVLLVPTHNPDGNQMVVDWYRKYVGTQYEGGGMPWLYHHYAGHDNNRDWYMFNLPETRAVTKVLYHDWLPQIHVDEHQMGSTGARLFVPPFMDPPLPNVQPLVWRGVNLVGTEMGYDLQNHGLSGVVNGRSYTAWWIGACDDTSWLHNVIGILSEAASVRTATPIHIEPNEIPRLVLREAHGLRRSLAGRLVAPARHRRLRARPVEEHDQDGRPAQGGPALQFLPDVQELRRERRQRPALRLRHPRPPKRLSDDAQDARGPEDGRRRDPPGQGRLHRRRPVLRRRLVRRQDWPSPTRPSPGPCSRSRSIPDMRQYPGGPPIPPYDNAAWTLPLQMGVACDEVEEPFEAKLEKIAAVPYPPAPAKQGQGAYVLLNSRVNASYSVAFALLEDKAEVVADDGPRQGQGPRGPGRQLHRQEHRGGQEGPARDPGEAPPGRPRPRRRREHPQGPPQVAPHRALPVLAGQHGRGLDALRLRRHGRPL